MLERTSQFNNAQTYEDGSYRFEYDADDFTHDEIVTLVNEFRDFDEDEIEIMVRDDVAFTFIDDAFAVEYIITRIK